MRKFRKFLVKHSKKINRTIRILSFVLSLALAYLGLEVYAVILAIYAIRL